MKTILGAIACTSIAVFYCPPDAEAQTLGSRRVVSSDRYHAGTVQRFFAGSNWRELWAATIEVPVLDLSKFAGGLTPTKQGGNQSVTLRFAGKDGRTYIFRSVDKFIDKALNDDLSNTLAADVIQDQTSVMHPTGALVASRLEEKAGLLHARPQLVLMPDDPRLGEFRKQFGNLLGTIEERPDEAQDGQKLFGGADKIVSTIKFVDDIEETLAHRLNSREYLKARLIDFLVGDTDRGADQWRWARYDRNGEHVFRPIPRDHDYSFMRPSGWMAGLVKTTFPKLVIYGNGFPRLNSLTFMTRDFDRTHLSDLPWAAWDSVVTAVQSRLSDQAIVEAVSLLPPEHRQISGTRITDGLRTRRDRLRDFAREFYEMVNREADVFGTEEEELALVDRQSDGSVLVSLFRKQGPVATDDGDAGSTTAWQRRFVPTETKEIRIYLQGGNDRAIVRGFGARDITVRITGGAGNDTLADSTAAGSGSTVFYDAVGQNMFVTTSNTRVDTKQFRTMQPVEDEEKAAEKRTETQLIGEERRGRFQDEVMLKSRNFFVAKTTTGFPRTFGSSFAIRPAFDYRVGAGLIVGAGPVYQRYGFRHVPRAWSVSAAPLISTSTGGTGLQALVEVIPENASQIYSIAARATTFEGIRFNGFGNDTERLDSDESLVLRDEVLVQPAVSWWLWQNSTLTAGPLLRYSDPRPEIGSPAWDLRTAGGFGQIGVRADMRLGYHDDDNVLQRGARLLAGGSAYPAVWDVDSAYGEAHGQLAVYLPLWKPSLALRVGGKRVWGDDFPLQDAAFVGGRTTLRGFQWDRYAGDAAAYASAEVRMELARVELLFRGNLGVFALADAGRVWFEGESPDGWHHGQGGGLWFETLGHVVSLMYAKGEQGKVYLQLGLPY